ncbi:MAG: NUDIX domain-containing protein [Phascolarctobacterium sp.]
MHFTFCPHCGAKLGSVPFGDDGRVPWCKACHKPFFDIFPVVAITMVVNEFEEVALLKPKYMSEKYYNFVSGYVQPGEEAELCAAREVLEEIGVYAQDVHFVCSQWEDAQQMLLLGFIARANKGAFALSEEINDAVWAPVERALGMVYPEGNITHRLLAKYLQQ